MRKAQVKRTCERCRALQMSQGTPPSCRLGYEMDTQAFRPLEPCPKPLTWSELHWLLDKSPRRFKR